MTGINPKTTKTKFTIKTHTDRIQLMILTGVFAAFTAACSIISFPLPFTPAPLNLALLAVFMAGVILGPRYGPLSQVVFILMGAIGIPVFANFRAGVGVLIGPTGGYLAGYVVAAMVIGLISHRYYNKGIKQTLVFGLAMLLGMLACYVLGTAWLMYLTKTPLIPALIIYAAPFIPGDLIKLAAAVFLSGRLDNYNVRIQWCDL